MTDVFQKTKKQEQHAYMEKTTEAMISRGRYSVTE